MLSGVMITEGTAESRKTPAKKETSETLLLDGVVDIVCILLLHCSIILSFVLAIEGRPPRLYRM
jgi:hypothetical protein